MIDQVGRSDPPPGLRRYPSRPHLFELAPEALVAEIMKGQPPLSPAVLGTTDIDLSVAFAACLLASHHQVTSCDRGRQGKGQRIPDDDIDHPRGTNAHEAFIEVLKRIDAKDEPAPLDHRARAKIPMDHGTGWHVRVDKAFTPSIMPLLTLPAHRGESVDVNRCCDFSNEATPGVVTNPKAVGSSTADPSHTSVWASTSPA